MFDLYNKDKLVLSANGLEILVNLVEILKKYNKHFINRKNFKIKKSDKIVYEWKMK